MPFGEKNVDEILANFNERTANKAPLSPEELAEKAEQDSEKQERINALLAEAALVDAGNPEAVARAEAAREKRENEYEKSLAQQELDQARDRSPFADY